MTLDITPLPHGEPIDGYVDATGLPAGSISTDDVTTLAREAARWLDGVRGRAGRLSLFDRSAYVAPDNPFSQMATAKKAVTNDDVVGGVCDVTEGLVFQGIKWEAEDPDDADVFNQVNADLNMDDFARTWHREMFTYSQVVVGSYWAEREYSVRGYSVTPAKPEQTTDELGQTTYKPKIDPNTGEPVKPTKSKRRRKYKVRVPIALTFLDPLKVVPLAPGPFGTDRLAWYATPAEIQVWNQINEGTYVDPVMMEFFLGRPQISATEKAQLSAMDIDPKYLIELNPYRVQRFCRTKATYERFPMNRLKSVFPLLDLKQQLMEADRVNLVGAANYILLIKKGSKEQPGLPEEIRNLQENMAVLAKLPVIVGDHRLDIEIITPKQDYVLDNTKYDTLDRRIINRTLGALSIGGTGQRNESTLTIARGVARLLESQRLMMKRSLESFMGKAMMDANPDAFQKLPKLSFTPRNVQLDQDAQVVQAIMALRTQNELSRETILEYFNFDQEAEAQRREYEEESGLDDIFKTKVPFASPIQDNPNGGPIAPAVSGAQGGRPAGGGATPNSPQAKTKPAAPSGNKSTRKP